MTQPRPFGAPEVALSTGPRRYDGRSWSWLALAVAASIPALTFRLIEIAGGAHPGPVVAAAVFGLGIVGAAFLIAWASEVAQMDISQALALALLALVAVLPEYAVDMVFAWKAGAYPNGLMVNGVFFDYRSYAVANMTGGNRLLVGIGWPLVVFLFILHRKKVEKQSILKAMVSAPVQLVSSLARLLRSPLRSRSESSHGEGGLALGRGITLELVFLGLATAYSFFIFFQKHIALWDAGVLISLFVAYIWVSSRAESKEPELIGPSAALGSLPKTPRRIITYSLFIYSALVILASAEPFADGLVEVGKAMDIDEFVLVQWVAPIASESPEILIAAIFTLQGNGAAAMMALISAKVNQWTLLVGCIPVVYSISLGEPAALAMDARQQEEFLLTAAQSLFAVVLFLDRRMSWQGALVLLVLFTSQLFIPSVQARYIFSFVYLGLTFLLFLVDWRQVPTVARLFRDVIKEAVQPR